MGTKDEYVFDASELWLVLVTLLPCVTMNQATKLAEWLNAYPATGALWAHRGVAGGLLDAILSSADRCSGTPVPVMRNGRFVTTDKRLLNHVLHVTERYAL